MVSLKDVAKLAGVSPSTVSRVINRTAPVEEETRRRVEEAIKSVNYRPNLLAQSLRLKVTKNIGLLVPEIDHPSFSLVIKYIEESASRRGLNLLIFNTRSDHRREAEAIDMLLGQKINGIIFSRVSDESHVEAMSRLGGTPMVIIDRVFSNERVPNVTIDNYRAGVLAAEHLIGSGCRHLATVTGNFGISICRERHQGFVDTLEQYGVPLDGRLVWEGDFKYDNGITGTLHFLDQGLAFDGMWCQNDLMAAGAITTLVRHGRAVPDDVAVVGMDNVQFTTIYNPSITTVAQPYQAMCETAVDYIDKLTNNEPIGERRVRLEPRLVIRESTTRSSGRD